MRDAINRVSTGITIVDYDNGMNMIRHDDKQGNFRIRIIRGGISELLFGIFPNFCHPHFAILDYPEIQFTVFGAYRDMIESAIIIMPIGAS